MFHIFAKFPERAAADGWSASTCSDRSTTRVVDRIAHHRTQFKSTPAGPLL